MDEKAVKFKIAMVRRNATGTHVMLCTALLAKIFRSK